MSINNGFIYKTTNLINNKIYVGKHKTSADDGYLGSGLILGYAVDKYGKEIFKREILEYCISGVGEREEYWIDKLDARNLNIGYNIAKGGIGGGLDYFTNNPNKEIIREKFRKAAYGRKHSEETKDKIRKWHEGRKLSNKTKQKLSELAKKRKRKPMSEKTKNKIKLSNIGQKRSEITKRKISESRKGKTSNHLGKLHSNKTKEKISETMKNIKKR